ncbi:MAG: GNAT family N-acetyltransferase [Lentisphaeria bacterium]|nr:GNAT family N-acetyltransferase [Lentisphaeria bacterium]
MELSIRPGKADDLACLAALEIRCFEPGRRARRAALRRSLSGRWQRVRLLEARATPSGPPLLVGAAVLWPHPRSLRVYSVAVDPGWQGQGLGLRLMADAETLARRQGCRRLTLEADASDPRLVAWYRRQGYGVRASLPDYYGPGRPAVRMTRELNPPPEPACTPDRHPKHPP